MSFKPFIAISFFCLMSAHAIALEPTSAQLEAQLKDFLHGASRNDHQQHDNFWAQELVYTSSSGSRFSKSKLMKGVMATPTLDDELVTVWYTAKDIHIQIYEQMATLTFTLVAKPTTEQPDPLEYLNSGTFIWRNGRWQALLWQATVKAPESQ